MWKLSAAQGELFVDRATGDVPPDWTRMTPENGHLIVGHSETGHHHVIDAKRADVYVSPPNSIGMSILRVIVREPTAITHLRGHDTHAPVALEPGEYTITPGREFDYFAATERRSQD